MWRFLKELKVELCANEDGAVVRSVIERHSGALRAVFVSTPAGDSEQATDGLSPDTLATLQPAQELAEWATTSLYAPLFIVVDGRGYTGENLKDLGKEKIEISFTDETKNLQKLLL